MSIFENKIQRKLLENLLGNCLQEWRQYSDTWGKIFEVQNLTNLFPMHSLEIRRMNHIKSKDSLRIDDRAELHFILIPVFSKLFLDSV